MIYKTVILLFLIGACSSLTVRQSHKARGQCWKNSRCVSGIACKNYIPDRPICVTGFCLKNQECPKDWHCNNKEILGVTSKKGVCVSSSSPRSIVLAGGTRLCTDDTRCPSDFYCNDEEIWGVDGKQGNCQKR